MFDRDAAVRTWRNAVLGRGGLTVDDADELQDHLAHIETDLRETLEPEEAFWVAAHRLGTPDALTREYRKVRPNAGWLLRAQWALLGLLTYWLLTPVALVGAHLVAAALSLVPALVPVAAATLLYASPLALAFIALMAVLLIRRLALAPEKVERVLLMDGSPPRPALLLALLVVAAWPMGIGALLTATFSLTDGIAGMPGEPAALQSRAWSAIATVLGYLVAPLLFLLVVRLQRHREHAYRTTE